MYSRLKETPAPLAVIDLGTNTFHLLIARPDAEGGFTEIYRQRRFVKLAEDGIDQIGPQAWQRGIAAMKAFAEQLRVYQAREVRALGTAALRTAANGPAFLEEVLRQTGIQVERIDGREEARLIHLGVSRAVPFTQKKRLIMDIGGGSVEFIIADEQQVFWSHSFPVGVAVLFNAYHTDDPISVAQQQALRSFLAKALQPLQAQLKQHPVDELVGASGTFDVLETYLSDPLGLTILPVEQIAVFSEQLIAMPLKKRLAMEEMPPARAEMLPVALILLEVVLNMAGIQQVYVSPYALKEGVLAELCAPL